MEGDGKRPSGTCIFVCVINFVTAESHANFCSSEAGHSSCVIAGLVLCVVVF